MSSKLHQNKAQPVPLNTYLILVKCKQKGESRSKVIPFMLGTPILYLDYNGTYQFIDKHQSVETICFCTCSKFISLKPPSVPLQHLHVSLILVRLKQRGELGRKQSLLCLEHHLFCNKTTTEQIYTSRKTNKWK